MKYYVYKTTNKINGKYYVGVHQSENIENDKYLGSGYVLRNAIDKYGSDNFEREILFTYETPEEGYHLDHIIPLRAFDPNDVNMIKLAHSLENLRWISAFENDSKSDKIYWDLIEKSEKLLEISSILKITKEDDGKYANQIFPIVDGKFIRRN